MVAKSGSLAESAASATQQVLRIVRTPLLLPRGMRLDGAQGGARATARSRCLGTTGRTIERLAQALLSALAEAVA
jgi:hypothetical protein